MATITGLETITYINTDAPRRTLTCYLKLPEEAAAVSIKWTVRGAEAESENVETVSLIIRILKCVQFMFMYTQFFV